MVACVFVGLDFVSFVALFLPGCVEFGYESTIMVFDCRVPIARLKFRCS
jgi:hypothetical protein